LSTENSTGISLLSAEILQAKMVKYCDISPCRRNWTPISWKLVVRPLRTQICKGRRCL